MQPGVGAPAQHHEHQAQHAEGQEQAARVDVDRDDGEAGDGARDCKVAAWFDGGLLVSTGMLASIMTPSSAAHDS